MFFSPPSPPPYHKLHSRSRFVIFCPRLNASRKKNKTHESNFLPFYPQIENKTFSFMRHIIKKKRTGKFEEKHAEGKIKTFFCCYLMQTA